MAEYVILSDSACDLTKALRERFGIADVVLGYLIYPDGHSEKANMDWENMSPAEYFGGMSDKKNLYRTQAPGPDEVATYFEPYLAKGKDVLFVALSSGISCIGNNGRLAGELLKEKYPDRKVVVVDSLRYSTSLSQICIHASALRDAGKTIEETAAWIEANRTCFHEMGPLDDLFFCKRMGRVSGGAAVMGTLVGIKPMADFDNEKGLSSVIGKARGYNKAFAATIGYMKQTIVDPKEQIVFVAHSNRLEKAEKLAEMIRTEIGVKEIILNSVGQSCGASIGPGLVAAFYFGKPISDGLVEEKAILGALL